jgi:hypothetical protein
VLPKKYKDNVPLNEAGRPKWAKDNYYKKIKFVDKKTGEIIKLDETIKGKGKTLKEYLDTTIAKETGEKRVFQKAKDGYELKNKIKDFEIDFKGNKERLGTLFAKASSAKSGDTVLSAFEVHHPYGKKNNWWNNQVALREANRELNYIDTRLQRAYKNAPTQAQKNKIFKQFGKEVDKLPGGITYFFEGQQVGTRMPTLKSILNEGAKYYQMAKPVAKKIASVGKAIAKPVVRLAAPIIPFAGPAIMASGALDVAKAAEQGAYGLDESPVAYYLGPEAALGLKGLKERAALSENTPYQEIEDYLPEEDLSGIVSLRGVQ